MTSLIAIDVTFTLLFLCLQHLTSALTCSGLTCHFDEAEYSKAVNAQDNAKACHILNLTANCLHGLIGSCEENVDWKKKYSSSAKHLITQLKQRQAVVCEKSPSPTLCADIGSCTKFVEQTQMAIETDRNKQACGSIQDSVRCLRDAVSDCSQSDVVEAAVLDNYTAILKNYENRWSEICVNVYSVQGQVVTSVQSLSVNSESNVGSAEVSRQLILMSSLLVMFNIISLVY